ncbi:hypothetical protein A3305_07715 (plasmid) [Rickettsia amblyommatis]|nr:hypothetical protein [Rickettsia amblyommatis]ARD88237.1 hypothetical protein A3305_07715 [Rickettsia amblyommatis]KJV99907.1 hypothetical protein RAMDARK_1767 [Rickettsia amblyommatis str. Darkwater]
MNNKLNIAAANQELILTIHNLVLKERNKEDNRQIEIVSNNIIQNITDHNNQDRSCDIYKCW